MRKTRERKAKSGAAKPAPGRTPRSDPDHRLLELQHGAGNAAVTTLVARDKTAAPPDPAHLDAIEADGVARELRQIRLDPSSVRAIQSALGTPGTGSFEPADAQALSHWQYDRGLRKGGTHDYVVLNDKTLNAIIRDQVAVGMEQEMIHLALDWRRVDTSADTLSVRFDPTMADDSGVTFGAGTLRVVLVGRSALKSAATIAKAVRSQLTPEPWATLLTPGATPTILGADNAQYAAGLNAGAIADRRSVLLVQRLVNAPLTGTFDADTSQFIAQRQQSAGLALQDGTIDDDLFHLFIDDLNGSDDKESLVRLVVDYRHIPEGVVIDASFDPNLDPAKDYRIVTAGNGAPTSIVFGPATFTTGISAASIEHTIARAYEEADLRVEKIGQVTREFLAFHRDLIGDGLTDEPFGFFCAKAVQALDRFRHLEHEERVRWFAKFEEIQNKVLQRFGAATTAERDAYNSILQDWLSVRSP